MEVIAETKIQTAIPLKSFFSKILSSISMKMCLLSWPILAIYLGSNESYSILKLLIGKEMAKYSTALIPSVVLILTLVLRRFKRCKVFSILLASLSCFALGYKNILSLSLFIRLTLPENHYFHFIFSFIRYNWIFLIVQLLPLVLAIFVFRYLWFKENVRNVFKIRRIKIFDLEKILWLKKFHWLYPWFNRMFKLFIFCVNRGGKNIKHCKLLIHFWPVGIIYSEWFQSYHFLDFISNDSKKHIIIGLIPLIVLSVTVLLHWLRRGSAFSIIVAGLLNIYVGYENVSYFILQWIQHFPLKFDSQVLYYLAKLNWYWFGFYSLPLASASLAARYLWSHSDIRKRFKLDSFNKSNNFGTAKLLDLQGIKKINTLDGLPIGAVPKISNFSNPHQVVKSIKRYGGDELIRIKSDHITLVAPSGSGKGAGIVIPTLLEYPGPVFVTDIKAENYCVTKKAREAKGKTVVAFDPFERTGAKKIRINPIDLLNPHSMDIVDDAQVLADLICPTYQRANVTEKYFQSQGSGLVKCMLLYMVCCDLLPKDKKDLILPSEKRNLWNLYKLICQPAPDLVELLKKIGEEESLAFGAAAALANGFLGTDPRERSGILNSARLELRFADTPYVRNITECSDIDISDITKGDIDLFICIPSEKRKSQSRLMRLMTGIVFLEMQKAQGKIGKHNLLMLLDEMPSLGYMEQIEDILAFGRGYGVSLMAISQTIGQMKSVYPQSWDTFFSNQSSIFFGCAEPMTSDFVARKLGKKTVETASVNESAGTQTKSMELLGSSSSQTSHSVSETGRDLLMPAEIERLGDRVVLAFKRGEDPILCHRIDYRERPEWAGLWDKNPLHANRDQHIQYSPKEHLKMAWQVLVN